MKFLYEYRTRDNAVHSGVVSAPTRDDAYAALKSNGVKPSRLVEAPGFFNKLFGKGKRWLTIGVLAVLLVAVGVALVGADRRAARAQHEAQSTRHQAQIFDDTTRRQVIGDSALVEKGILDGWSSVFPAEGERFLAGFAVPGVPVSVRNTTEGEIRAALARRVLPESNDSLEARQIKAMVEGMKQELREFLAAGGTVVEYGQRLVQRQELEIAHYNRAKAEIDRLVEVRASSEELRRAWEAQNDGLRKMGVKLVAWPEE